jgi:hypothetical protein
MHRRFSFLLVLLAWAIGLTSTGSAQATVFEEGPAVPVPPTTTASGIDRWKSPARGDVVTLDAVAAAGDTLVSTAYQWVGDPEWTVNGAAGGATALTTTVSGWLPADHSLDGVRTLRFYSIGQTGGDEAIQEAPVGIDTLAPTVTIGTYDSGWTNEAVAIPIISQDPGSPLSSGVLQIWYRRVGSPMTAYYVIPALPGGVPGAPQLFQGQIPAEFSHTVQAPATHENDGVRSFEFWPQDLAGNVGGTISATVRIDTFAPRSSASGWDPDTVYAEPVVVTLAANDPVPPISGEITTAGVEAIYFSVDGADFVRYTAPFAVDGEGPTQLAYYAVDRAGNQEATRAASIRFQGQHPPVVTFTNEPFSLDMPAPGPGLAGATTFRLTATDEVDAVMDVSAWTDGTSGGDQQIQLNRDSATGEWYGRIDAWLTGWHELTVRAVDESGNVTQVTRPYLVEALSEGLERPVSLDGSSVFRGSAVVPLRLYLRDPWSGQALTDKDLTPPTLTVIGLHPGLFGDEFVALGKVKGLGSATFSYRGNGLWTLNWNVRTLAAALPWYGASSVTVELQIVFEGPYVPRTWTSTIVSVDRVVWQ